MDGGFGDTWFDWLVFWTKIVNNSTLVSSPNIKLEQVQTFKNWLTRRHFSEVLIKRSEPLPLFLNFSYENFFKVPITPKYFFRLNNSLHLFETHCTFLPLFSPNLDFL